MPGSGSACAAGRAGRMCMHACGGWGRCARSRCARSRPGTGGRAREAAGGHAFAGGPAGRLCRRPTGKRDVERSSPLQVLHLGRACTQVHILTGSWPAGWQALRLSMVAWHVGRTTCLWVPYECLKPRDHWSLTRDRAPMFPSATVCLCAEATEKLNHCGCKHLWETCDLQLRCGCFCCHNTQPCKVPEGFCKRQDLRALATRTCEDPCNHPNVSVRLISRDTPCAACARCGGEAQQRKPGGSGLGCHGQWGSASGAAAASGARAHAPGCQQPVQASRGANAARRRRLRQLLEQLAALDREADEQHAARQVE